MPLGRGILTSGGKSFSLTPAAESVTRKSALSSSTCAAASSVSVGHHSAAAIRMASNIAGSLASKSSSSAGVKPVAIDISAR